MRFFSGLLLFIFISAASANTYIREFKTDSLNTIINENKHPFILVIWSLECPPCLKELSLLSQIQKESNPLKLVLISTDSFIAETEIKKLLKQFELSKHDNWIFSGDMKQKLRFTIDPKWYGELPRSYFYKNQNYRIARSGALDKATLNNWLKQISRLNLIQKNSSLSPIEYDK